MVAIQMKLILQILILSFAVVGCSPQTPIDVTFQVYQQEYLLEDFLEGQLTKIDQDSVIVFEYQFGDSLSEKYRINMTNHLLYHYVSLGGNDFGENPYFIYVLNPQDGMKDQEFGTFWTISLADQNKNPVPGKRGLFCSEYGLIFLEHNESTEGHILSSIGERDIDDTQKMKWYWK